MKLPLAISCVLVAGCGSRPHSTMPPPPLERFEPAPMAPGWARAGMLRGDWRVDEASPPTSWLRPGGLGSAIYGVDLQATPSVIVMDDEPVELPAAERRLRMWFYAGGAMALACDEHPGPGEALAFTCGEAGTFRYWQNGPVLDVETDGQALHLTATDGVAAPELEEADRQFARDTAARGAKGWVSWFAEDGEQWRGDRGLIGHAAIEEAMTKALEAITLEWQPTVSRLAPDGQSGYTAGTSLLTMRDGSETQRGTYVTLWVKTPAGWKVRFDTGRDDL